MNNWKNIRLWLHGLVAAAIGGAASAVVTMSAVKLDHDGIQTIKQVAIWGAIGTVMAYFKRSPLPPGE